MKPFASVVAVAGALAGVACGGRQFVLPTGTGVPVSATESAAAYADATARCRGVSNYSARVRVSHLSGSIIGLLTSANEIYLLYTVSGQTGFALQGQADGATLSLPRDRRFVKARAEEIVEALIGAPLDPRELMAVLSGCGVSAGDVGAANRFGDTLALTVAGHNLFLQRPQGTWQVVAATAPHLHVDYSRGDANWPRTVRLSVAVGDRRDVQLTLTIDQVETNITVNPRAFVPEDQPAGATPMTLDELREIGPLRGRK